MNITKIIIVLLLVLIIILFTYKLKNKEHLSASNEAVQTIATLYAKVYADNNKINTITTDNLCVSGNNCITSNGFNALMLINSPINSYMYLPNSSPTLNDQNLIWKDISNNIRFSDTVRPNAAIQVVGGDSWRYWTGTAYADWNGYSNPTLSSGMTRFTTKGFEKDGGPHSDGVGIEITVPIHPVSKKDYSVLWIKLLNDKFNYLKIYDMSGIIVRNYYGKQSIGNTSINNISPDGSTNNSEHFKNGIWWPFPIDLSGNSDRKIKISNFYRNTSTSTDIAGVAFSTNPWNHCMVHGNSLYDQVNNDNTLNTISQTTTLIKKEVAWNNTIPYALVAGSQPIIRIPFVNTQRNKMFYIVEQNETAGPSINGVEINTTPESTTPTWQYIGNLTTSFSNPFATHSNSKLYQRYYGVIIPKEYLPDKNTENNNFIQLRFTIPTGMDFKFTEVGTHDVNPFE